LARWIEYAAVPSEYFNPSIAAIIFFMMQNFNDEL
jgi:hypothetical protein